LRLHRRLREGDLQRGGGGCCGAATAERRRQGRRVCDSSRRLRSRRCAGGGRWRAGGAKRVCGVRGRRRSVHGREDVGKLLRLERVCLRQRAQVLAGDGDAAAGRARLDVCDDICGANFAQRAQERRLCLGVLRPNRRGLAQTRQSPLGCIRKERPAPDRPRQELAARRGGGRRMAKQDSVASSHTGGATGPPPDGNKPRERRPPVGARTWRLGASAGAPVSPRGGRRPPWLRGGGRLYLS
jgi:hypothetical protein